MQESEAAYGHFNLWSYLLPGPCVDCGMKSKFQHVEWTWIDTAIPEDLSSMNNQAALQHRLILRSVSRPTRLTCGAQQSLRTMSIKRRTSHLSQNTAVLRRVSRFLTNSTVRKLPKCVRVSNGCEFESESPAGRSV